ncbi:MAG: hypothetical protein NUW07_04270 [Candidatus Saccharicenans sp.]|jgi:hypothetical protein|nr:hypothetical protein [Candidatus Saccharicenans sp.]MDH7493264.1 hypothetical protein [Candidatus Saccharicenans sp.]
MPRRAKLSSYQINKFATFLLVLLSLGIYSFSSPAPVNILTIHLWVFKIPGIQHIREEFEKDGHPFVLIKGADLSFRFPEEGMLFTSRVIRRDAEQIADFLRSKIPENNLGKEVKVICLLEEKDIQLNISKNETVLREDDLSGEKNLTLWIEGKNAAEPGQIIVELKLKIKSASDSKTIGKSECLWNVKEQMYLGLVSGPEKNKKPDGKLVSKKGNIYFIVLLNERDKVEN